MPLNEFPAFLLIGVIVLAGIVASVIARLLISERKRRAQLYASSFEERLDQINQATSAEELDKLEERNDIGPWPPSY